MRGAKRQSRDKVLRAGLRQEVNPITEPRLFGLLSSTLLSSGVGAETQRPLATVVVGGLFTSTAQTLLILPLIYE